jgi:hypothetical protein
VKFEAIAKAGESKDGKARWHKCGAVFESAKGLSLKIDSLPVGFDGWLSLREPRPKDAPATAPKAHSTADGPNDDIPF